MGGYSAGYQISIRINEDERKRTDKLCLMYSQHDIYIAGLNTLEAREEDKLSKERGNNAI